MNAYVSHNYCYSPSRILFLRDSALNPAKITLRKKKEENKKLAPLALQWLYLSNERLGGHNIKLDITMEQDAHVGYSTPAWRATPNLPTCGLLLFWRRPAWRLLAEERRAYRWLPGLPSSPPLSSGHLPPDTSAPEVVCKVLKNQHNLLTWCHEINSHEINSQKLNLPRDQLSQDLVRVDLVAIDLVRID